MINSDKYKSISYNPETGEFINKRFNRVSSTKHPNGYIMVSVGREKFLAHRLAWEFVNGEFTGEIDHIDNDKTNNSISNLRLVTRSQNQQNMPKRSNNTSGVKGVSWCKSKSKWRARVIKEGVDYVAGYFSNIDDAKRAIEGLRDKICGQYANHGRV